jgi:hypothetical protein
MARGAARTGLGAVLHFQRPVGPPVRPRDGPAGVQCLFRGNWSFDEDEYSSQQISAFPMEGADEGEQTPRRRVVKRDFAREPFDKEAAALVVERTPAHVDGLDA